MSDIFVCDLDGVLLNTQKGFSKKWSEILGRRVYENSFIHWDHALSLGVDKSYCDIFWKTFWQDIELDPYPGAGVFVNCLKYMNYKVYILTSRSTSEAQDALWRDIDKIRYDGKFEIDDVIVCDHRMENKSTYINNIPDAKFFLDDHVKNVADVQMRCDHILQVMLLDRDWNNSADIGGYLRVKSYGDVLQQLSLRA